ncbi:MAG: hypothetical protein IT371_28815 [Deltaproteobacteria bacterium]|nr:hypothetical protein [Deltaproteobacteria bacterium]
MKTSPHLLSTFAPGWLALLAGLWSGCPGEYASRPSDGRHDSLAEAGVGAPLLDGEVSTAPIYARDGSFDGPCAEARFPLTETQETFAVPKNARYMHVKAWGSGGNGQGLCTPKVDAGMGGFSEAVFAVEPGGAVEAGTPLIVIVGKRGRSGSTGEEEMRFGFGNRGGGGLTGIFLGPERITEKSADKALVIAGGGGGAASVSCAPAGPGNHDKPEQAGGQPTMKGGDGGEPGNGGAGGYRGGAGGGKGKSGRGGTGFVHPKALQQQVLFADPGSSAPRKSDDPEYDGKAGKEEASGWIVISFNCKRPNIR